MKVYATIDDPRMPLRDVPDLARRAEHAGFSGLLVPEAVHDGFLTAMAALTATSELRVATSVVLAFPRSPTVTAMAAWDLQALSGGRFELGLGSQVKGNIVGRYGMPWSPPVQRMRDYVGAVRAVWRCWQTGEKLDYTSESYTLDRMQPFFRPDPLETPNIPIFLGGVKPHMMRLAGEIADGLMTHPTNTGPRYLRECVHARLSEGIAGREDAEARALTPASRVIASVLVATGATDEAVAAEREAARSHLGFLFSTPQYWPTLELYGHAEVGQALHALTREGRWGEMNALISDEILDTLVPSGPHDEIAAVLAQRYEGLAAGVTLRLPRNPSEDTSLSAAVQALREYGKAS